MGLGLLALLGAAVWLLSDPESPPLRRRAARGPTPTRRNPDERVFHRIIRNGRPTLEDFMSAEAMGRPLPRSADAEVLRLWSGVSVFATLGQAQRKARQYPFLGRCIARITVPPGAQVERTLRRSPGHHTVWALPDSLLRSVVDVLPVEE